MPKGAGGERTDGRRLRDEFERAGYARVANATDVARLSAAPTPPARILGLFHATHLPVAFDKVGAGRYSDELARPANAAYRDTPMLEDLARLALAQPLGAFAARVLPDGRGRVDRQARARASTPSARSGT